MNNKQTMLNQVNAIISFLPENERNILPQKLVDFFKDKATIAPEQALDISLPLGEQNLTDETMLMLYYINNLLKNK